jgi:murein DD-endopeptidase MepM/ murein hydrolase activator NlpD
LAAAGLATVLIGAALFFSTELLTQIIYQNKLKEIRSEYHTIAATLTELQERLDQLDAQMAVIEEKDRAIRTYADLPQIDQDIRALGIGGARLESSVPINELAPKVKQKLSELELDIDRLSREVKLELASYETIYDRVRENAERMRYIPSIRPVLGGYLNSGFGYRRDPFDGRRRFHYGLDITVSAGAPVFAPADGVVQDARYRGGFGKYIKINHGHGYTTMYAHLSQINVKRGERVKRGDLIGRTGNTGRSTAPHLHYEVHYFGTPQNPMDYFFAGYLK